MFPLRNAVKQLAKYHNLLFFVGGFLFDAFTLTRIDSVLDLVLQSLYLGSITAILIFQHREAVGRWQPAGWTTKLWSVHTEAIHFLYGALLSAYVIFYFKSASASKSLIFLALIAILMIANEMPQVRRAGFRMRLGLHAFCVASYLNYLIPVLVGRMGVWTFALALLGTILFTVWIIRLLIAGDAQPQRAAFSLGWPAAAVLVLLPVFYAQRWIPPVPLSLQFIGIYHDVQRVEGGYEMRYPKPAWYRFLRKESRPFLSRPGDVVHCFTRVFAPRRFHHQLSVVWSLKNPTTHQWQVTDRVPLPISGGRGEGYRGFAGKSNYQPGRWRVEVQTEDSRSIGAETFEIQPDSASEPRLWRSRRM